MSLVISINKYTLIEIRLVWWLQRTIEIIITDFDFANFIVS